jgi:hypothetical protein
MIQCSVWPSFFTRGTDWPIDGEVDIVQNYNLASQNRYALQAPASASCTHSPHSAETGSTDVQDCTAPGPANNSGCGVLDPSTESFGQNFANAGGGVFAAHLDGSGVRLWFFPRNTIPSDITSGTPDLAGWPTPSAFYQATQFLGPQTLGFVCFVISFCFRYRSDY